MFNLLIALITGVLIGWNFHAFYTQLNPPKILKNDINISKLSQEEIIAEPIPQIEPIPKAVEVIKTLPIAKEVVTEKVVTVEKNISQPAILIGENFYTLLKNNLFSDAMTLYIDAKDTKLSLYRVALLEYFEEKIQTNPQIAIEQMLELHELEPKNLKVNEEQLHDIEYNDNPTEQATELLKLIKQIYEKKPAYKHKIPLQKVGDHYSVEVQINDTTLVLLLDTGATLTMVNESKLPLLTILKENIVLTTAGGKINAQLQEADAFNVGNIELSKFQIVSSAFEQEKADGLLGMNFFKKFKFKIDQEKDILHLSSKEEVAL
ncbi:MAG: Unknown protein [uncultured Sulfurovum sp.]|uniref:Peptidase A2 domain-containing protein n=1 Tax=uncultured Sulfurovum sp. TaxID=269237 RepID=A0A6S6TBB4_9BACT|nr:MAG: Unknown protein [uncultured Sulfurovum sp.]